MDRLDRTSWSRCRIKSSVGVRIFSSRGARSGGLHYSRLVKIRQVLKLELT
jgi:hypothetical protein